MTTFQKVGNHVPLCMHCNYQAHEHVGVDRVCPPPKQAKAALATYIFLNGCDGGELTEMQPEWRILHDATESEAREHCLKLAEHLAKRGNFVVTVYRLTEVLTAQLDPKTGEHFVDLAGNKLSGVRKPFEDVWP